MPFLEGDAVVYLKQVNGQLEQQLREARKEHEKREKRLMTILREYIDDYGFTIAYDFHKHDPDDDFPCTAERPCQDASIFWS